MIRPGSNKATNNDLKYLNLKINLRLDLIKSVEIPCVLDCFAGDSIIWNNVNKKHGSKINRFTIDADSRYKTDLTIDCLKYLKQTDLSKYNIIDVDSWGSPVKYINEIFQSNFKGYVVCTYCSPVMMNPDKILALNYYGEIYNKSSKKILLNKNIGVMFKKWLLDNGVTEFKGYISKNKIYCSFEIK
jgi:hypothetical protein